MRRAAEKSHNPELLDGFMKEAGSLEEEREFAQLREARLTLMCRARMLLVRVYKAQSLTLHAVLALQKGLRNYGEYTSGSRRAENGEDEEYKGLAVGGAEAHGVPEPFAFILPGKNAARPPSNAPGGKKAPAKDVKKPPAKAAPSTKNVAAAEGDPEELDEQEKEFRRVDADETAAWKSELKEAERYPGAGGFYWLRMKAELIGLLVEQKRLSEAKGLIQGALEEAGRLQDNYFPRLLQEAELWIDLAEGKHAGLLDKV